MAAPWAIDVVDEAPLTIAAVVGGHAWVALGDAAPVRLGAGQIGIVRGPEPYRMGDAPETPASITVLPDQRCVDHLGRSLEEPFMRGVRTWGNDPDGPNIVLVGTYGRLGESGRFLLDALPTSLVVDAADIDLPVVELLADELARDVPGQSVVLDRLLDLLTVTTLRAWLTEAADDAPGWWRAASDPIVGPALRLLQHNPEHPWTVGDLGAEVGASRAALAKRFSALVGQPPMAFLTEWRLALAADLLLEPGATVEGVARRVGYSTGFALSAAFKRVRGCSPRDHRAAAA